MNSLKKSKFKPPSIALWILKLFCRKEYMEEIKGDLQEVFDWRVNSKGPFKAKIRYFLDALSAIRFLRFSKSDSSKFNTAMISSFIKSSFRNFRRHWSYTLLNVIGLSLGMMAALFILEYVSDELSYNDSSQADQVYRVSNDYYRFNKMIYESSMTFSGVGPAMERDLPEVESYARLYSASIGWGGAMILTRPDEPDIKFKEDKLFFADPNIMEFFDLEVTHGTNELGVLNRIMLTAPMAEKYFGSVEAALGKTLRYNDNLTQYELQVAGIFKKPKFNLQVDFDVLISYLSREQSDPERFQNDWGGNAFITFVKVMPGADAGKLEADMSELTLRYRPGYAEKNEQGEYDRVNSYFLTPIANIHLNSKFQNEVGPIGDATTIRLLQIIALFIVTIAWINFINLTTAKSVDRAREVGVRKVMGAKKNELVLQFFTEAFLVNLFALTLAIGFVLLGQPLFDQFVERPLLLKSIDFATFGIPMISTFLLGALLSGLYPAFVLSSHQVVLALKGKAKSTSGIGLRRGLILFQLLFSSLLMIATMAINRQLNYMNNQDMGFDMEQVLILRGPVVREVRGPENVPKIKLFKDRLKSMASVNNVGTATIIPGQGILRGIVVSRVKGGDPSLKSIERVVASNDFLSTLDIKFSSGRDFDESIKGYEPIIINQRAARELGFENDQDAIGQLLYEFGSEEKRIVGVFQDYHHESLNRPIDPMYFIRNEGFDTFYAIRLTADEVSNTLTQIEALYEESFPGNPARYYFLDQYFNNQYKKDEVNSKVFSAFAIMAIIVACLGLYGLSSFSALQRTKEIGVRKVLGAKVKGIFFLLSREIIILSILGFALAIPIAYYGIQQWLDGFAYHINISALLFVLPMLLVLAVTLLAVSQKIIKTALMNPVKSLRYE